MTRKEAERLARWILKHDPDALSVDFAHWVDWMGESWEVEVGYRDGSHKRFVSREAYDRFVADQQAWDEIEEGMK